MTWFYVDDKLAASRKVLRIPRARRLAAVGLWTLAGSWAAGGLTDGSVPDYMLEELGGTEEAAQDLVDVGLWEVVPGGWLFHDWSDWQQTREQVETKRDAARARMRKLRNGSPDVRANERGTSQDVRDSPPSPPLPLVPTEQGKASGPPAPDLVREDVVALGDLLADLIVENGSSRPNTAAKSWTDPVRLMLDRDQRTPEQVAYLMRWSQRSEFWRRNILSTSKLREQWDRLRLAATEERARPQSRNGLDWDDQMARAAERDAQEGNR